MFLGYNSDLHGEGWALGQSMTKFTGAVSWGHSMGNHLWVLEELGEKLPAGHLSSSL